MLCQGACLIVETKDDYETAGEFLEKLKEVDEATFFGFKNPELKKYQSNFVLIDAVQQTTSTTKYSKTHLNKYLTF